MADSGSLQKAAEMLGLDTDAVEARLEKLSVNDVIDALDAVSAGDNDRVRELLGNDVDEDGGMQNPEGEDDGEFDVNPLFMRNTSGGSAKQNDDREVEEEVFNPKIGDEVRVNGEDGIVKVVNAPNETTGVMIDGQTTMVKKAQVKRVKHIEESMMVGVPSLQRIQQLAGMAPSAPQQGSPLSAGAVDLSDESFDAANDDTAEIEVSVAPVAPEAPIAPPAPPAVPAPEANLSDNSIDCVMASFDQIAGSLPHITLADAKDVRERINDLLKTLNEGLDGRRRKP